MLQFLAGIVSIAFHVELVFQLATWILARDLHLGLVCMFQFTINLNC